MIRVRCLFVCADVLRPSKPNGVMSSTVSLPNHMFTDGASSSKWLTSIVHILSPETDNCPSWISDRERMTVENISWSLSMKEWCRPGGGWTHNLLITSWSSGVWILKVNTVECFLLLLLKVLLSFLYTVPYEKGPTLKFAPKSTPFQKGAKK